MSGTMKAAVVRPWAHIHQRPLECINAIFDDLRHGNVDGRIVIPFSH